jgi:hypothetical protein
MYHMYHVHESPGTDITLMYDGMTDMVLAKALPVPTAHCTTRTRCTEAWY